LSQPTNQKSRQNETADEHDHIDRSFLRRRLRVGQFWLCLILLHGSERLKRNELGVVPATLFYLFTGFRRGFPSPAFEKSAGGLSPVAFLPM
jgi:hypothetical protein